MSSARSWAVSASITSLSCPIWPCFISSLITSALRSAMRLASSWMVMVSGMVTSRTSFSFGSSAVCPFNRCTRRRKAATERSRSSSALSAVTTVSRLRFFCAPLRGALGAGAGRAAPGPRRVRGTSSSSGSSAGRAPGLAIVMASSPKRFFASCSALSLVSRSCLRRLSSSALRVSAASRMLRTNASSSAILRSSASRNRASLSAWTRAFCSSSVRLRNTMPPDGLEGGGNVVWVVAAAAGAAVLPVGGRLAGAGVAASAFARVGARLFTFSTTTALVRPWLKLWRTTPCSTPRPFRVKVLLGVTLSFFSPVFSVVSAIPIPTPSSRPVLLCSRLAQRQRCRRDIHRPGTRSETLEARGTRQKRLAFRTGEQGCMYHICPPQCQIQLRRGKCIDHHDFRRVRAPAQGGRKLFHAVGSRLDSVEKCHHVGASERRFDIGKADRDVARLVADRENVERGPFDQTLRRLHEIGSKAHVALEGARKGLTRDRGAQGLACRRDPDTASG